MSTLDSSWVVSAGSNGLAAHNSPAWMSLYLAVCKLLDLTLALPAASLPQFQMYRWAFVSESSETAKNSGPSGSSGNSSGEKVAGGDSSSPKSAAQNGKVNGHASMYPQQDFVPYVVRVAKLLLTKVRHIELHSIDLYFSNNILFRWRVSCQRDCTRAFLC